MKRGSPMLPDATLPVPASLMNVLAVFGPLFTVPSFRTFCGMACGFLAQTGKRTVCGMLAKLVIKDTSSASRLWLARRMAEAIAGALPGRAIRVVADSAYAGGELKKLPATVTWTTRLRKDAALHELPPARTGQRGRPRT